jgi:hypothetical protein
MNKLSKEEIEFITKCLKELKEGKPLFIITGISFFSITG